MVGAAPKQILTRMAGYYVGHEDLQKVRSRDSSHFTQRSSLSSATPSPTSVVSTPARSTGGRRGG